MMQYPHIPSLFETSCSGREHSGPRSIGRDPHMFGLLPIALIYLGAILVLLGLASSSRTSTASMQHVVWPATLQGATRTNRVSLPKEQPLELKTISSHESVPVGAIPPSLPQPERATEALSMPPAPQPPTVAQLESPSPLFSPGMWAWLVRVSCSLLLLLGFHMYDRWHWKSAIAMVAVSGETPADSPEQPTDKKKQWRKSHWTLFGRLFRASEAKSQDPSACTKDESAVLLADGQEAVDTGSTDAGNALPAMRPQCRVLYSGN